MKNLYPDNYKTLPGDSRELNKWKDNIMFMDC